MTRDETQELKRLAESATDIREGAHWYRRILDGWVSEHDKRLISATTPSVVLSLIARIEELEGK